MPGFPDHSATGRLDHTRQIGCHLVPEGVVSGQNVPALAAQRDDGAGRTDRLRIGVERPMETGWRTILVGEPRRRGPDGQGNLSLVLGDLLYRKRNSRIGKV